jgi:hypothetical protein
MKVWIPLVDTGRRIMIQRGKIKIKISKTFIYKKNVFITSNKQASGAEDT